MKYIFQIALMFSLTFNSCSQVIDKKNEKSVSESNMTNDKITIKKSNENNCEYIKEFDSFRQIIEAKDVENSKKYIDLPFDDGNIWHLIFIDSEEDNYNSTLPLKEEDYKKYYNQIFPTELVESLTKVKVEELFNNGSFETLQKDKLNENGIVIMSYKLNTSFNKVDEELTLQMYYEYHEEGEVYETSVNYIFTLQSCKLRIHRIIIAG